MTRSGPGLRSARQLLLDGPHLIGEALDAGLRLQHLLVAADAVGRPEIATLIERVDDRVVQVATGTAPVMDAASPVQSASGAVALATRPLSARSLFDAPAPIIVVASDVQDPGNVGAIIRVAEAAGASGVVVAGQCADPFGWKALRGSMGSALRLPIATFPTLADAVARTLAALPASIAPPDADPAPTIE